ALSTMNSMPETRMINSNGTANNSSRLPNGYLCRPDARSVNRSGDVSIRRCVFRFRNNPTQPAANTRPAAMGNGRSAGFENIPKNALKNQLTSDHDAGGKGMNVPLFIHDTSSRWLALN